MKIQSNSLLKKEQENLTFRAKLGKKNIAIVLKETPYVAPTCCMNYTTKQNKLEFCTPKENLGDM